MQAGAFWDESSDGDDEDGSYDDNYDVVGDGEHVREILMNYVNRLWLCEPITKAKFACSDNVADI